ncbi:hypothetical protein QOT17_007379 [Balamuthia mandrillaris]
MTGFNTNSADVYTFEPWRMGVDPSSGSVLLVDAQSSLKMLYTKEGAFVQNKHGFFRLFPEVDKPAQKLKQEVPLELPEETNPTPLLLGINLTTSCGVKYWTTDQGSGWRTISVQPPGEWESSETYMLHNNLNSDNSVCFVVT